MQSTIHMRAAQIGDQTEVQVLIKHPMDSGFAKDPADQLIPARYIETLKFEHNGKAVFVANWGPMIAKQPYVKFSFKGGRAGDTITARWIDSTQAADSVKAVIEGPTSR
jgi:sulfur-oxidizing protein SoxZ